MKTVVITGGSSFTALWIANAFCAQEWKVHVLLPQKEEAYTGLKKLRLSLLKGKVETHFGIDASDGEMESWVGRNPADIWIHHHHYMKDFRSLDYDYQRALEVGVKPIRSLVKKLKQNKYQGVIFSGSYFEPGEGGQAQEVKTIPYAQSKFEVWQELTKQCKETELLLSKIVIPNPFGPLENEDRLIPTLMKKSSSGEKLIMKTSMTSADQLPVRVLARRYVNVAETLLEGKSQVVRPSGLIVKNREWIDEIFENLFLKNLNIKPCNIEFRDEPYAMGNLSNSDQEKIDWDEEWSHYAGVIKETSYDW